MPVVSPSLPVASRASSIGSVSSVLGTSVAPSPFSRWRAALATTFAALCLTVLFAAAAVVQRAPVAGNTPTVWFRALAISGLDWGGWLLLVWPIVAVGRRIRLDAGRRVVLRLLAWLVLGVACCVAEALMTGVGIHSLGLAPLLLAGRPVPPLPQFLLGWVPMSFGYNLLIFCMIAGVVHAVLYYGDLRARQLDEAALRERLARAELGVLRMQLQPHFLFNALHTVSSLMEHDVPAARRVITALGDLLRASLDHTALDEISLHDEVAFLSGYVAIQQARFRRRLEVTMDIAHDTLDAFTPSLVLQPLVENAIRHGIEPSPTGGSVVVSSLRQGHRLVLAVRDDGSARANGSASGANGARRDARNGTGIGLANLRARLAQLYGDDYEFHAGRLASGEFQVTLSFPYRTSTAGRRELVTA